MSSVTRDEIPLTVNDKWISYLIACESIRIISNILLHIELNYFFFWTFVLMWKGTIFSTSNM